MQPLASEEIWKPVTEFPAYEVSNFGRLRRAIQRCGRPKRCPHIMKLKIDRDGYEIACFSVDGIYHYRRMARVVLLTFVGPPPNDDDHASHNNGVPNDDRLVNLRWATPKSNNADKIAHGTVTRGSKSNFAKLTEKDVVIIRNRYAEGVSRKILGAEFGIHPGNVWSIATRHSWKHVR